VERQLKERLIGAAVLVAVAIILIPEMLSGPPDSKEGTASVGADGGTIKTYTIDLRQRREGVDPNAAAMPPPELPSPETPAAEPPKSNQSQPAEAPTMSEPAAEPVKSESMPAQTAVKQAEAPAAIAPPSVPESKPASGSAASGVAASGGWAVQVASLDNRAAAEKIVGELKRDGFAAFVMPVEVNGKTKFRVRVGPATTRAAADALLVKVKRTHVGATVMRHP